MRVSQTPWKNILVANLISQPLSGCEFSRLAMNLDYHSVALCIYASAITEQMARSKPASERFRSDIGMVSERRM
jgi:hypothetical protein